MKKEDIEHELDIYHTHKILSGKGLEDDPDWIKMLKYWNDKLEE